MGSPGTYRKSVAPEMSKAAICFYEQVINTDSTPQKLLITLFGGERRTSQCSGLRLPLEATRVASGLEQHFCARRRLVNRNTVTLFETTWKWTEPRRLDGRILIRIQLSVHTELLIFEQLMVKSLKPINEDTPLLSYLHGINTNVWEGWCLRLGRDNRMVCRSFEDRRLLSSLSPSSSPLLAPQMALIHLHKRLVLVIGCVLLSPNS